MSTPELISQLTNLAQSHAQVEEIKKKIATCDALIHENKKAIDNANITLSDQRDMVAAAQKEVDNLELDAEVIQAKESVLNKKLKTITKQREAEAVEKELHQISRERSTCERMLERAWNVLTLAKKKYTAEQSENKKKTALFHQNIEKLTLEYTGYADELEQALASEKLVALKVPNEWVDRYKNMMESVSDPIVQIVGGSCSACYYSVVPQDANRLRKGDMLSCRSCYRFIYLSPEQQNKEANPAY